MSSVPSNVAAHATATSAPDHPVCFHRDPCVPGAVGAGVGTQHRFHSVRPCEPALLAVLVAEGRPRGGCLRTVVRGVQGRALPLPRLPTHWAACWGPSPTCCGRGRVGVGAHHCPLGPHALWGLRAAGLVGGRPRGGWPATVVRGVWCQVLSLPRPPVERAARVPRPVCPGCGRCGRGDPAPAPQRAPLRASVARCGGGRRASPGGCFPPLRGAPEVRRSPSSDCPPTRRAVGVRYPRAVGAGVWVWGRNTVLLACTPCGGCVPRGCSGAVPGGGMACHRCEGHLVSGAVPPPTACPLGRAAGVPRPVCSGCGRCGR